MRALMGFGEAGFTSIAPTVLGDLYSPEDRTVVLALFYYAIPVGRWVQLFTQPSSLSQRWGSGKFLLKRNF